MDNPESIETSIIIQKYLPRITVCLEEIALGLNYLRRLENDAVSKDGHGEYITKATNEIDRSEGEKRVLRYLKDNKKERK